MKILYDGEMRELESILEDFKQLFNLTAIVLGGEFIRQVTTPSTDSRGTISYSGVSYVFKKLTYQQLQDKLK